MRQTTSTNGVLSVSYTGTLAENKAERIADAKAQAQQLIFDIAPEWKQINSVRDLSKTGAVKTAATNLFAQIDAVRAKADTLEARINACTTLDAVWAVNIAY